MTILYLAIALIPLLFGGWFALPDFLTDTRHPLLLVLLLMIVYSFAKDKNHFKAVLSTQNFSLFINAFFFLAYIKYAWFEYASFNVNAIDFSLIDLLIPFTMKGDFMYSPVCDCNHFGIHTNYILFLFYPFYALFGSPYFALFLHPIALFVSVYPLRKICQHFHLDDFRTNLLNFSFLSLSSTMFILKYQFHLEVFFVPFFFFLMLTFFKDRKISSLFFVLLSISVKEDAAFYLIPFFSYFLLKREKRTISLFFIFILLGSIILNFKYVLPTNQGGDSYKAIGAIEKYGSSFSDLFLFMIKNPLEVLENIFLSGTKKHLIAFLFIPIFSPITTLPIAAFALIHAMAGNEKMFVVGLYYSAPLVPFLYLGFIYFITTFSPKEKVKNALLGFLILYGSFVGSGYIKFEDVGNSLEDFRKLDQVQLKGKKGCVQASIVPHLSYETTSYLFDKACLSRNPDYILINDTISLYPHSIEGQSTLKRQLELLNYELEKIGNFQLYKKISKARF